MSLFLIWFVHSFRSRFFGHMCCCDSVTVTPCCIADSAQCSPRRKEEVPASNVFVPLDHYHRRDWPVKDVFCLLSKHWNDIWKTRARLILELLNTNDVFLLRALKFILGVHSLWRGRQGQWHRQGVPQRRAQSLPSTRSPALSYLTNEIILDRAILRKNHQSFVFLGL